jgi:hypothetical protein
MRHRTKPKGYAPNECMLAEISRKVSKHCPIRSFSLSVARSLYTCGFSKSLGEAFPKDVHIEQRYGQRQPPDHVKHDSFVWIQHVQARPQIESVHPLAQNRVVAAKHVGIRVGERTVSPASSPGGFVDSRNRRCHFVLLSPVVGILNRRETFATLCNLCG